MQVSNNIQNKFKKFNSKDKNFKLFKFQNFLKIRKKKKIENFKKLLKNKNFNKFLKFKYYDDLFNLFINKLVGKLLKKGKKLLAIKLYKILKEKIKEKTDKKILNSIILILAMANGMSKILLKKVRFGGLKKELPFPLEKKRQVTFAIKSLLDNSKVKNRVNLNKLVDCIIYSYKNKGSVVTKKLGGYKTALDNKILLTNFIKK